MNKSLVFASADEAVANHAEAQAERVKIDFAVELDQARRRCGLSMGDLAERLQCSAAYITKVLRGDANFTIQTMVKLALAVDADLQLRIAPRRSIQDTTESRLEADAGAIVWSGSYRDFRVHHGAVEIRSETPYPVNVANDHHLYQAMA